MLGGGYPAGLASDLLNPKVGVFFVAFLPGFVPPGYDVGLVTIVLGAIPHDKICVTSHAALGFHAAWDLDDEGHAITNPEATHMLYSMYPSPVKKWINQRGGLTPRMIYLRGKELTSMYHACYLDARASAPAPAAH